MKRIENFEIESTHGMFRLADHVGHPVVQPGVLSRG